MATTTQQTLACGHPTAPGQSPDDVWCSACERMERAAEGTFRVLVARCNERGGLMVDGRDFARTIGHADGVDAYDFSECEFGLGARERLETLKGNSP